MNDIIEDHYIKYFECLSINDKNICDKLYLGEKKKETDKKSKYEVSKKPQPHQKCGFKNTWRFVNRGNFIKK